MTEELNQFLIECNLDPSLFTSTEPFLGSDGNYHTNYIIKNKLNNKIYYGKHSTSNLNDNYFGSGKHIENSLKKYGKENFMKTLNGKENS